MPRSRPLAMLTAAALAVAVTGEVSIEKSGPSGNVSLRQQRTLTLAAGESGAIGRTGLSFAKGDLLEVSIVLRVGEMVVAQASSTVGSR
jgi:hypothetical protein